MNNIIPTFKVDFFERNLKLNEIEKIKILYNNLKYSLYQNIIYNLYISESNDQLIIPPNIQNDILTLNNIESLLELKSNKIISILNSKLYDYSINEKNDITKNYIERIFSDNSFESKFSKKIFSLIKEKLSQNKYIIESQCKEQINKQIIEPYLLRYKDFLNKENEIMNNTIFNYKQELISKLSINFTLDLNLISTNIDTKVNQTKLAIEEYYSYFKEFKISNDIIYFFEESLVEDIIIPKYNDINYLINQKSNKYIEKNFDFNYNNYKNKYIYSINNFKNLIEEKQSHIISNIDKYIHILNNHGTTKEKFKINLQREIDNYNNGIIDEKKNFYDINYDIALKDLKNTSFILNQFISNFNISTEFEDGINKKNKNKNMEYKYSKYILSLNTFDINNYFLMLDRLNELNDINLNYFDNATYLHSQIKEILINKTIEINELLKSSINVTYEIINANYIELNKKFNLFKDKGFITKNSINIPSYIYNDSDAIFSVETEFKNFNYYYDFNFDINNYENNIPKIIGNLTTKIIMSPDSFIIDLYRLNGLSEKIGKKINIDFNNIYSFTNILFDGKKNNIIITTNFNAEEYSIDTKYYEEKIKTVEQVIYGIKFLIPNKKSIVEIEKNYKISSKNEIKNDNYSYNYDYYS